MPHHATPRQVPQSGAAAPIHLFEANLCRLGGAVSIFRVAESRNHGAGKAGIYTPPASNLRVIRLFIELCWSCPVEGTTPFWNFYPFIIQADILPCMRTPLYNPDPEQQNS
jgi:hypothetical protein